MKTNRFLKPACATIALFASATSAIAADWVLSDDLKTLTYKDWVFNCSGTAETLHIASVQSYPETKTDFDFSQIEADTGAKPVSTGNNLLASHPNKQGNYVGSVTIAPTMTRIGANFLVYSACTNLVIPAGSVLTAIPDSFINSSSAAFDLTTIPESVTNIGSGAFSTAGNIYGPITVPAACLAIGNNAFYGGNSGLKKVTGLVFAPGSKCERIGAGAFQMSGLPGAVKLPSTIEYIGGNAFVYTKITSVDIPEDAKIAAFNDGVFSNTSLATVPRMPASVTSIGKSAFAGCESMTGPVVIPASVLSVGDSAFDNCCKITEVVFEDGCRAIGSDVFASCHNLTNVVFPRTLKTVGGGKLFGGTGHLAQWRAMSHGDIWWKSAPEIADGSQMFLYGNANNNGSAGAVTNHLSFAKWSPYADANPDSFVLPDTAKGVGTWTSPVAGATGSAVASIVNWDPFAGTIVILR